MIDAITPLDAINGWSGWANPRAKVETPACTLCGVPCEVGDTLCVRCIAGDGPIVSLKDKYTRDGLHWVNK
jgi:hypothetical protein